MAQAIIWIPARVADAQPAGVIPDAVAGDGNAEKRVPACINGLKKPSTLCRASTSRSWPLSGNGWVYVIRLYNRIETPLHQADVVFLLKRRFRLAVLLCRSNKLCISKDKRRTKMSSFFVCSCQRDFPSRRRGSQEGLAGITKFKGD